MERIFDRLNDEQRRAVEAVRGPVCILAGAGSGKTTTITRRIAHQVTSGAFGAGEVLAVTFTDKAAGEMRARLAALGVAGVRARTFHSAALAQLRGLAATAPGDILASKGVALRQIANRLPKPYRFRPAADLATEIEWAKNRRIGPDRYLDALGSHQPPIPADLMVGVFKRYERGKEERGLIDFEDLLELAVRMFQSDEYARERFAARYRAFTVDEYQDVNLLQETLLREWLGERDDLCVVGDDYQSIYGFTGATPQYLLGMPARFPGTTVVRLESNYRSTPEVLTLANRLVPALGGAEKVLRATLPPGPQPMLRGFASASAEIEFIADSIRSLQEDGVPFEEMAVLYRVNFRSEDYEETLAAAKIPFQVRDGAFLSRQSARHVLGSLKRSDSTDVAGAVRKLAERAGYLEELPDGLAEQELTRQGDLARLIRLAEEFDDGTRASAAFVADIEARFGNEGEGRGVNLMTLHRAKGLEFDAVFIPRVEHGELPFKRARSDENVAEERRLFYVGITRARRHLAVTCVNDGRRRASPFFAELSGEGASPKGVPSRRRAPPAVDEVAATIGLELTLPGGFSGAIVEIGEDSASVELDDGALVVVPFGERVKVGGRARPLGPEKSAGEELFQALKKWRLERAKADGVPPYIVFHDSTLEAIAERRPTSLPDLERVEGLGPVKLERYGREVLEVLARA